MGATLGVFFGVLVMISWGTADFFVAKAVNKISIFKTFFWSQIIGVALYTLFSLFLKIPEIALTLIPPILITGFLGTVAYLSFYRGLQKGKVSIVSPIAACWSIITVVLSLVLLGEELLGVQALGVGLSISGAILTSFRLHDLIKLKLGNLSAGVGYALIALLSWSLHYFLIDILVAELNWFFSMLSVKTAMAITLTIYSFFRKESVSFPSNAKLYVFLIGVFEFLAYLAYGFGINSEFTAIVAPIASAFPLVTIILAKIFLKESLEINQTIGITSVLMGLFFLSMK